MLYLPPASREPFGGIRVMYQHVAALRTMGVPAAIVTRAGQQPPDWFGSDVPTLASDRLRIGPADALVLPEWNGPALDRLPAGIRCLVFNQGPYYTFTRVPEDPSRPARPYDVPGVVGLLTVSHDGVDLLRHTFPQLPVFHTRPPIDPAVFRPAQSPPGRRIGYLARGRRAEDRDFVLRILRQREELRGWELLPISGTQAEVAAAMRSCAVFLAFGYREGFGLPVAEAMASGCYVVGYAAMGARELFRLAPSTVVDECDVRAYAIAVRAVLDRFEDDPAAVRADGLQAAESVASTYSLDRLQADLQTVVDWLGLSVTVADRADG